MRRRQFLSASLMAFATPARAARAQTIADDNAPLEASLLDFIPRTEWAAIAAGTSAYDIAPAIAKANAAGGAVNAPAGRYYVGSSCAFSVPVQARIGAVFERAADQTLTFAAGLTASPFAQLFAGPGLTAFDAATTPVGYPEWWGAKTNAYWFDCLPALKAAVAACPEVRLAPADYWISDTWKINTDTRTILGSGINGQGPNPATRVIVTSRTRDAVQIGPDQNPGGGPNSFLNRVEFGHITCTRSLTPTPPPSDFEGPSGLRVQFAQNVYVHDCWSVEHSNGFYLRGLVYCLFERSFASRVAAGSRSANDYFAGWLLDARDRIGLNAGLASVYIKEKCGAYGGVHARPTYGVYTLAAFTDTFISDFETSSIQYGAVFNADAEGLTYPSENLRLNNCIFDQVLTGIAIKYGGATTNVSVVNCYVAPTNQGGGVGIHIEQISAKGAGGAVSLEANEIIGSGGESTGLLINQSSGVTSLGNLFTDINNPVVMTQASQCRLQDRISNATQSVRRAAIQMTDGHRNVISCDIGGGAGRIPKGVELIGADNHHNEIMVTGIDPDALVGGAQTKLVNDGVPVTAAGSFGASNLASGLMK